MASVALLDLTHARCPEQAACVHKRVRKYQAVAGERSRDAVVLMADPEGVPETHLLQMFAGSSCLSPRMVRESSTAASLYSFKQTIDRDDVSHVRIVTSSRGRDVFRVFQELLFTASYDFEYIIAFDSLHCPLGDRDPLTRCKPAEIRQELAAFLQRLPAVTGEITILRSSSVSECFGHGFTTRTGGISHISTLSSLNLFCNPRRKDPKAVVEENRRRLAHKAGYQPQFFNLIKCDHASDVWVMGKPAPDSYDAMVTNQSGVVIAAPGADCMPLIFTDPVAKVIGVAHAGWKGTLMEVAMETVKAMVSEFGSRLADIVCVIGPSVGPCCFILEKASAREFQALHPDCVRDMESPTPHVDIRLATRVLLERGGLKPEHIENIRISPENDCTPCTSCSPELFFSHVRDGLNFGTQIGFVWIK